MPSAEQFGRGVRAVKRTPRRARKLAACLLLVQLYSEAAAAAAPATVASTHRRWRKRQRKHVQVHPRYRPRAEAVRGTRLGPVITVAGLAALSHRLTVIAVYVRAPYIQYNDDPSPRPGTNNISHTRLHIWPSLAAFLIIKRIIEPRSHPKFT